MTQLWNPFEPHLLLSFLWLQVLPLPAGLPGKMIPVNQFLAKVAIQLVVLLLLAYIHFSDPKLLKSSIKSRSSPPDQNHPAHLSSGVSRGHVRCSSGEVNLFNLSDQLVSELPMVHTYYSRTSKNQILFLKLFGFSAAFSRVIDTWNWESPFRWGGESRGSWVLRAPQLHILEPGIPPGHNMSPAKSSKYWPFFKTL